MEEAILALHLARMVFATGSGRDLKLDLLEASHRDWARSLRLRGSHYDDEAVRMCCYLFVVVLRYLELGINALHVRRCRGSCGDDDGEAFELARENEATQAS